MGIALSKSRYTKGMQCPKMLWMDAHMRDKFDESVMNQAILDTGSRVGDVAMGYYGDFVEVPYDRLTYSEMIALTKELLDAAYLHPLMNALHHHVLRKVS